jgi:DNA-directed RNA polymerase subunit RPC12/RpoP
MRSFENYRLTGMYLYSTGPVSLRKKVRNMTKCALCGQQVASQPTATQEAKCSICGKEIILKEEKDIDFSRSKSPDDFGPEKQ